VYVINPGNYGHDSYNLSWHDGFPFNISTNDTTLIPLLKDVVSDMDYDNRVDKTFIWNVTNKSGLGAEDSWAFWKKNASEAVIQFSRWPYEGYHRDGKNHTEGDVIDHIDNSTNKVESQIVAAVALRLTGGYFEMPFRRNKDMAWNMITIPFDNHYTAKDLCENLSLDPDSGEDLVSGWDPVNQTYKNYIYNVTPDERNFDIENGTGYFVWSGNEIDFYVSGPRIKWVSVDLYEQWNLIGWFHNHSTMASSLCENITNCTVVSKWDAVNQTYENYIKGIPESDFVVDPGNALFVWVESESTWHGEG
jgi:hypothetical protein